MCQLTGTKGEFKTVTRNNPTAAMPSATRKRLIIRGTSTEELVCSTSFFVAPHWML
jgi:hypothetical protein